MTEKEKQIEEMREIVSTQRRICHGIECAECDYRGSFGSDCIDERNIAAFYSAGYRKQSEVAENIIAMLRAAKPVVKTHFEAYDELIENIAAEYGAEEKDNDLS